MNISVIGIGYVGLVSAVCFAELGHNVIGMDNDLSKIRSLQEGRIPIHERHLPELLQKHLGSRLKFTDSLAQAVQASNVIFVAVGTPPSISGDADLGCVHAVVCEIAGYVASPKLIVGKSTFPVHTCDAIRRIMVLNGAPPQFLSVASNPEFLREGTAVSDFLAPDRIVLGVDDTFSEEILREIYAPLLGGSYYRHENFDRHGETPLPRLVVTSSRSAELIKYASNAFLAMKISFINAIANIAERVGGDIDQIKEGVGSDRRIGMDFLNAGIGYGGSCFPKDLLAFRKIAQDTDYRFELLDSVMRINQDQRNRFVHKVRGVLGELRDKRIAVLGLAFKAGTDDLRESPAIEILRMLLDEGCLITAFDPVSMPRAREELQVQVAEGKLEMASDPYNAAADADAMLILTDSDEFSGLDLQQLRSQMRLPVIIDGRNLYRPEEMEAAGFTYHSVGRTPVVAVDRASVIPKRVPKQIVPFTLPGVKGSAIVHVKKTPSNQRYLVTGAAGFLGSHLCDALLADGHVVVGVDNFSTGCLSNLAHLKNESRFTLLERDICEPFDAGAIDCLFNFASPASPADYLRLGPETLRVGSSGTQNALQVARKYGARFLHASTSECYGDPDVHPQPETYWGRVNPVGPRSVYDEAKRFSEALVMAHQRYHHVDTRMVRIFNTYGPRLQPTDGRVISNFMTQALLEEDLTIYGDGSQTRSFCYVSDLIDGILRLARSEERLPINMGNPEEWTILECAREVLLVTGSRSRIRYEPLPQDDPTQRRPDIARARSILKWQPSINLRHGLELSLDYFRANLPTSAGDAMYAEIDPEPASRVLA
jgi:nucleotide sugar dehydrogenase